MLPPSIETIGAAFERFKFAARAPARLAAAKRKNERLRHQAASAIRKFRPRKSDGGAIVFIDKTGKRLPHNTGRRGYPIYVTKGKKKSMVRQRGLDKKFPRVTAPRKLSSVDVSDFKRVKARRNFLRAHLKRIAQSSFTPSGKVKKRNRQSLDDGKHDLFFGLETNRIDGGSVAVDEIADKFFDFLQGKRSKKDFTISFGIFVRKPDSEIFWISEQVNYSRRDSQSDSLAQIHHFFSSYVYHFVAKELKKHGLVLNGSAEFISRLVVNKKKTESRWKNSAGEKWQGAGLERVKIERVEFRIDQRTLGK